MRDARVGRGGGEGGRMGVVVQTGERVLWSMRYRVPTQEGHGQRCVKRQKIYSNVNKINPSRVILLSKPSTVPIHPSRTRQTQSTVRIEVDHQTQEEPTYQGDYDI